MIDLSKFEPGEAVRCRCGDLLSKPETTHDETVYRCERCGTMFAIVLTVSGERDTFPAEVSVPGAVTSDR